MITAMPGEDRPQLEHAQHEDAEHHERDHAHQSERQLLDRDDPLLHLRAHRRVGRQVGGLGLEHGGDDPMHPPHREAVREQDHDAADQQREAVRDDPADDLVEVHGERLDDQIRA